MGYYSNKLLFLFLFVGVYCEASTLIVSSVPDSAKVYINKVYQGKAPLTITDMKIGSKYDVLVEMPGYESYSDSIVFTTSEEQKKNIVLKVRTEGSLSITSVPEGAMVYIDSVYQGKTPLSIEGFKLNRKYELLLELIGYKAYTDSVFFSNPEIIKDEIVLSDTTRAIMGIHNQARIDAGKDVNEVLWFCVGLFGSVPGVILAYAMESNLPYERLLNKSADYVVPYEKLYRKEVKDTQVKYSKIGCGVSATGCCIFGCWEFLSCLGGC